MAGAPRPHSHFQTQTAMIAPITSGPVSGTLA